MKQALHIFLKDARRCWPFSAVVLAITAALAYIEPRWVPMQFPGTYNPDQAVPVLDLLLGMAWWFTIAHLVHGEGLVGDRQFWVTRPYSWSSLFLSKVLFCATFLSTLCWCTMSWFCRRRASRRRRWCPDCCGDIVVWPKS
jgi:hypothetical protein